MRAGVNTLVVDPLTGVETEKGLGALLVVDAALEILGPGLQLELRSLLVEQEGPNLRNELAHGLVTDAAAWSANAVYAWWLIMRIAVVPVWVAMHGDSEPGGEESDE